VQHDRIAGVLRLAGAAEARPERVVRDRAEDAAPPVFGKTAKRVLAITT
jgi:hypothetical protein